MAYEIRPMTRGEIDLAVEWAAAEGWNPGLHDADPFFAADPDGFLIGLLDGEPIGCISAVGYQENFGFIGFYIVKLVTTRLLAGVKQRPEAYIPVGANS